MSISEIFLVGGVRGLKKITEEESDNLWGKIGIALLIVVISVVVYFLVSNSSTPPPPVVIPKEQSIDTLPKEPIIATLPKQSAFSDAASKMFSAINNNGLPASAQADFQSINSSISQALASALNTPFPELPTTPSTAPAVAAVAR